MRQKQKAYCSKKKATEPSTLLVIASIRKSRVMWSGNVLNIGQKH